MKELNNQAKSMASQSASGISQMKNQMQNYAKGIGSTVKQQELLISKINDLKSSLNMPGTFNKSEILEMEAEVEKLENRLIKLQSKEIKTDIDIDTENSEVELNSLKDYISAFKSGLVVALKDAGKLGGKGLVAGFKLGVKGIVGATKIVASSLKNIIFKSKDAGTKIGKSFTDGIKSIKKFTLGLLSVRTAFSTISKAVQSYLSYDSQLSDSIQNCWNVLGSQLAPILEFVVGLFSKAVSYVNAFIQALTGINLVARANKKAIESQAKATQKLSDTQSSLDEFHTISKNNGSGSSNNKTITVEDVDISPFNKLLSKIREIINAIKNGDWSTVGSLISEAIIKGLSAVKDGIKRIDFSELAKNISNTLKNVDFSGIFTGLVSVFGEAVLGLQDFIISGDWENVFANFGNGIRDAFFKIDDYISQIKWSELGTKLSETFISIDWGGIGSSILTALWNGLMGIVDLFLGIDWKQVGAKISDSVHEWVNTICEKFAETDWEQLGKDIIGAIFDFIEGVDWLQLAEDMLKGLANGLIAAIGFVVGAFEELFNRILEFFGIHSPSKLFEEEVGVNLIEGLINGVKSMIDTVIKTFEGIWEEIKKVFGKVGTFFKDTFKKAWEKVKEVFSTGGKIFDGIKDGIADAFKTIVNAIIRGINKVVKIPFDTINSVLTKIKNIDILGAKPFKGLIKTISVPQIPELAGGGVLDRETVVKVAEYTNAKSNPEIISPRDMMKETMKEAIEESGMNNQKQEVDVNITGELTAKGDDLVYVYDKAKNNKGYDGGKNPSFAY